MHSKKNNWLCKTRPRFAQLVVCEGPGGHAVSTRASFPEALSWLLCCTWLAGHLSSATDDGCPRLSPPQPQLCVPELRLRPRVGEVGSWHSYVASLHEDLGAANR